MKRSGGAADLWILAASVIVCLTFWYWTGQIYAPAVNSEARARNFPIGQFRSDLYPRWLGARELLLRGRDPYSADVTREIQIGFYGRPLDPHNKADPRDKEGFAYPVWAAFVLAPTITLPFAAVMSLFRWVLMSAIVLSVPLWMYACGLRLRFTFVLSAVLLALSSMPAVVEYYQQNLFALMFFFLAIAAACLANGRLACAGFLLALATTKPDSCGLLVLWFVFWAVAGWRDRQRLLWSFSATMVLLLGVSEAVSPAWIPRFVAAVRDYSKYATTPNILQLLFPSAIGILISYLLLALLVWLWFRWRTAQPDTPEFRRAIAWTCIVTLALIPKIAAYNQLLLIPPLLVLLNQSQSTRKSSLIFRSLVGTPFGCLLLAWSCACILSFWSMFTRHNFSQSTAVLPDHVFRALVPLTLLAVAVLTFRSARLRGVPVASDSQLVSAK